MVDPTKPPFPPEDDSAAAPAPDPVASPHPAAYGGPAAGSTGPVGGPELAAQPLAQVIGVPQEFQRILPGHFAPLEQRTLLGMADALLKAPANVAYELNTSGSAVLRLVVLVTGCMAMTGIVIAAFSGGYQFLAVPLKLSLGLLCGALLCLPSLYIFSCLSDVRHSFRGVAAALLMGLGVQALLLTGFAPIAWVFSQSTNSPSFMGGLYLLFYAVSAAFGLGLTSRVLAREGRGVAGLWVWHLMFVVVILQLTTTLRPLIGPFETSFPAPKCFFLAHWIESLGGA